MKWFVEVVEHGAEEKIAKLIECDSERAAERVERGVNINLNHERFFTRLKEGEPFCEACAQHKPCSCDEAEAVGMEAESV
jgi:hypothetical protein